MAKRRKTETQINTLDDGGFIDLSTINNSLTDRAKRFVFYFTFPGTDCFQHKTRSAIRAGYAKKNAVSSGYKLFQNPVIKKEVERLSGAYASEGIDTAYRKYINSLETRAFFDPADFISGTAFKPIEEIDPDKRVCLEQPIIDMKEGKVVGYQFGSRRAAMKEIEDLHAKEHPAGSDGNDDGEATMEIIKERLTVRLAARKAKDEISKIAGFVEEDGGRHLVEEL